MTEIKSIFFDFYNIPQQFKDRLIENKEKGVDVIIPVINTNELFERNLYNFYERIPINRLLIGDGGCTDDTIAIAKKFPRVQIFDQSKYISQGYCIKELIERAETDNFIYLHADVFLPEQWFENMFEHIGQYEWFECKGILTNLIVNERIPDEKLPRAFSGAQMGKREFFKRFLSIISDDYLQRNEDIILHELVE